MTTPEIAVTIGAYKLPDFVRLNIRQLKRLIPDSMILVSDDASGLQTVAEEEQVEYTTSEGRMSHCSGDWQAFMNACLWGIQTQSRISLKISQRLIPSHADFLTAIRDPLQTHDIVIPAGMNKASIARSSATFYSRFPVLTDIVAWRTGAFTPEELMSFYRASVNNRTYKNGHLVEFVWHHFTANHRTLKTYRSPELANRRPGTPILLRKCQATEGEYHALAQQVNLVGSFNLSEWNAIEGKQYMPKSCVV